MLDYDMMRIIWWVLLGVLLIGFAIMDGFDLGTGMLLPFVARSDIERRVVINTIGPVWEGNQVWLVLGAGAIFAAWPTVYAAAFSGFYLAMFLVLGALILRPVGFKFRSKLPGDRWRTTWDWALFIGGTVPALVFGVAFGNLFLGVPFTFSEDLRFLPHISLIGLLNPFGLLVGLVSVAMLVLHGTAWLNLKTTGMVKVRVRAVMPWAAVTFVVLFILAGVWVSQINGYHVATIVENGPSNPLAKTVTTVPGGWFANFSAVPWHWAAPVLAILATFAAVALRGRELTAFCLTSLVPLSTIGTAGLALFPFMLPSSTNPSMSLTVWDASASKLTLGIMLGVTVIFMPIIIIYTSWVYHVLRGPVLPEAVRGNHSAY